MPALAASLACIIIGIADGDTLKARCEMPDGQTNITVRVAEIDAPEKRQAWGQRSRQHLAATCFEKVAVVRPRTTDRYGRTVARVECDGTDASAEQVRAGMAWVFDRYVTDRSLYAVQDEARSLRTGLWADAQPMSPWEWRRAGP
jgi:endonuclease YncB( thermonuclease family)